MSEPPTLPAMNAATIHEPVLMAPSSETALKPPTNRLAILSLIFGVSAWCVLPFIGSVLAVILGHMAREKIQRAPAGTQSGDSLAIGGLILGYAQLFITLVSLTILLVVILALAGNH